MEQNAFIIKAVSQI